MDTILFFHTSQREAWQKELAGAYRFARARRWRVQVVEPPEGGSVPPVKELLEFWKPVGCIAECSGKGGEALRPALFGRVPTVWLGCDPATLPRCFSCVTPAPAGVGERAARELMEAGIGHFAFVGTGGGSFWSRDREAGFSRALSLNGRKCAVYTRDAGSRNPAARASALSAWLKALPKPCGILAENDYAAVEVIDLARRVRIRVPEDLAVIGVDNDSALCENVHPALTSIALDFERAGYRACEILDGLVRTGGAAAAVRETYPSLGIVRRGSTPLGLGVPPRIHRALSFIREKATEGIGADEVAALLPGSRRRAEIEFRRYAGRGIYEEIERVRFENVELLLRDRYRSLGAIAGLCGWRTEKALRAAFRKRYGISMTKWRGANAP